jgi:hypothetical protein
MNISKHATFAAICTAAASLALADEAPSVKLMIPDPVDAAHAGLVYQQILSAARHVCQPLESKELARTPAYEHCVDQAVAQAVAQVRSNALTEVHMSQVGAGQLRR